jgi:hypothetical protein
VVDLLVGAGRAWLGWGSARAAGSRWTVAAAVLGVLLPFAMAAIAVLLLGGGRFADLLLSVGGPSLPVYGVGRWCVVPALAFALPVLAARMVERRRATGSPHPGGTGLPAGMTGEADRDPEGRHG